jgi:mannose/cellobiose epimerase-like protein (N-acyl-D-glucosamine 2-epimerase family)
VVVFLVIANTVAATGAVLVALQAAMFETGRGASPALTADAAGVANADLSWQQGEVADAAWPTDPLQFSERNLSFG